MAAESNLTEIENLIKRYISVLIKGIKIKNVYLFGSYASGKYNENSDIDLLVVSPDFKGDCIEDMMVLMRARRNIDTRIEPHPLKEIDFNENNLFLQGIKKEMIKVF